MLSEHELVLKVREIYPEIQAMENEVLDLFNAEGCPGRGPTGLTGDNELACSIQYLRSTANMLETIGKRKGLLK
jgi:hypothetical protein